MVCEDPALNRFKLTRHCCKHCGIGPSGFSVAFDRKTGSYKPVWDKYCSMGCCIAGDDEPHYVSL